MSTSTVAIAVQMEGTAKAVTDLGMVDTAVKEVEKGAKEAGGAGAELAVGLGKAEGAARKLAGINVWDSYKQGAAGAVASVDSLSRSLGEVRAVSKASSLSGYNAEIDKLAKLSGVSTSSMAGLVRQMDAVRRAEAFDGLQRSAGLSTVQLARLRAEMGDVRGAFGTLATGAGQAKLAIAAVAAGVGFAAKTCLDAALQVDKLDKAYSTITGSAAGAQTQLEYVREVSNRLGLEFYSTAEGAKTFFAAGQNSTLAPELNRIFEGVSSAGAALALSKDEMQGAFLAIGQMISKGKVQAEELRGQLGERLPGAFQLAAQAMGMTTAQLDKFMADGKLTAEMLLPKLATVLQTTFGGAALQAANGLQGQINRFSTAWTDLKAAMVDSDTAASTIGSLATVLKALAEHGEAVTAALAWVAWTAGAYGLIKAFTALRAVFMAINFATMATAAGTLVTALGPVGLAAVAGLAAVGITKLVSSTQSADDIFKRHQGTIDAYREKMGLAAAAVDDLSTKQSEANLKLLKRQSDNHNADITGALQGINAGISGVNSFSWANVLDTNGSALALVNARKEIVALGKDLAALGDKVTKQDLDAYAAKVLAVDERVRAAGLASREWNTAITGLIDGSDSFVVKMAAMILKGADLTAMLDSLGFAATNAKAALTSPWIIDTTSATAGIEAIEKSIRGMQAKMAGLGQAAELVKLLPEIDPQKLGAVMDAYGKNGLEGMVNTLGDAYHNMTGEEQKNLILLVDASSRKIAASKELAAWQKKQSDATKSHASAVNQETRNVGAYQSEIDQTAASIRSLQAQLATKPGEVFTREQLKIAADYETTLARINKETAAYAGKNGVSQAQADKLADQKKVEAGLQRDLDLKQAQVKEDQRLAQLARDKCEFYKELEELSGRYGLSIEDQNKLLDAQEVQLRRLGIPEEYIEQWRQLKELQASHDWVDGAKRGLLEYQASASDTAKGAEQAFSDLFNGLDSGFNGMWADLIEKGKISLSSFKSMFASFLADLMHMAITRPITVSIAGAVGGMLPGATGTANAAQAAGSGFGMPNLPISSIIPESWKTGFSDAMQWTLPGTAYVSGVPAVAGLGGVSFMGGTAGAVGGGLGGVSFMGGTASAVGGGLPAGVAGWSSGMGLGGSGVASSVTGAGAAQAGGLGLGTALGMGSLGGLGYSLLGGAIGLPQSKYSGVTAAVGGTLGSLGGSALASSAMMAGSGMATGAAFGSVIPVVGTIIGAIAGGLLGGVLGGGRKTRPSVYTRVDSMPIDSNYDYTAAFTGGAWYDRAGSKEAESVMPVLGEAAKVAAQQVELLVAALPEEFRGEVEKEIKDATFAAGRGIAGMDKHNWNFQFYDEEQLKERLTAVVKDIQVAIGKTAQEAMANVDISSMYKFDLSSSEGMDKAVKAVTSVKEITEATKAIEEPVSQLVEQAKAAKKQMDEWTASMEEYGVVSEYAKTVVDEYQRASIKANLDSLESLFNPLSAYEQAVKDANQTVDDHVAALKALGGTEAEVARLEGMRGQVLDALVGPMKLAFDQDMRVREAQLTGNADLLASTQLSIQQERELADVRAKFGAESAEYARTQGIQLQELAQLHQQAAQAVADAIRSMNESLNIRTLNALGKTDDAALLQMQYQHRQELADARKQQMELTDQKLLQAKVDAMNRGETLGSGQAAGDWTADKVLAEMQKTGLDLRGWYSKYGKSEGFADIGAGYDTSAYEDTLRAVQEAERNALLLGQNLSGAASEAARLKSEYDNKNRELEQAKSAQKNILSQIESSVRQLKGFADAVKAAADALGVAREQLWQGDANLSMESRLSSTQSDFERLFALAMSGDSEAAKELPGIGNTLLSLYKETASSSEEYNNAFYELDKKLRLAQDAQLKEYNLQKSQYDALMKQYGLQETQAQTQAQILAKLQEYQAELAAANKAVLDAQKAASAAQQAAAEAAAREAAAQAAAIKAAQEAAEAARKAAEEAAKQPTPAPTPPPASTPPPAAQTGPYGGRSMSEVLEDKVAALNRGETLGPGQKAGGWTQDSALREMIRDVGSFGEWYEKFGRAEGFATGGITPVNLTSWAGMQTPFWTGERGPELVVSPQAYGVLNNKNSGELMQALSTPSLSMMPVPTQSGDRELRAEITLLREELKASRAENTMLLSQVIIALNNIRSDTRSIDDILDDTLVARSEGATQ